MKLEVNFCIFFSVLCRKIS